MYVDAAIRSDLIQIKWLYDLGSCGTAHKHYLEAFAAFDPQPPQALNAMKFKAYSVEERHLLIDSIKGH